MAREIVVYRSQHGNINSFEEIEQLEGFSSKKTKRIVFENIIFSLAIKAIFLTLAGFGETKMIYAIFADVGISLIAVMNSLRLIARRK